MDLLCEVCDRELIENKFEHHDYLVTLRTKINKSLYEK